MTTTTVDLAALLSAAKRLQDAARYVDALELLESVVVDADEGASRLALEMTRAEVVGRRDYVRGLRSTPGHPLDDALALAAEVGTDATTAWDLDMLELRRRYADQLVRNDGSMWFGPEGRNVEVPQRLGGEAARLRDSAPDRGRRGWALMCLGWVSDNLVGDRVSAPAYYTEAFAHGRESGDDMLVFEAQRHLGDHAHDDGDHDAALAAWQESAEAAARAGHVTGVLAQQVLLAVVARDTGDEAGSTMLAGEVRRWAAAIGAVQLVRQANGFLAGVDPTRAPEPVAE